MEPFHLMPRLAGLAVLLLALLVAGVPAARATAPAMPRAQASPLTVAVAEAASPATGHIFVVSRVMEGAQAGRSWLTMLDAHSGKVLRTTPLAAGAQNLAVDDRTQRAFVLSNGGQTSGPVAPVLAVLDARTATPVGTIGLGKGALAVWSLHVVSRLGLLFVVTNPDQAHPDKTPNTLRVFDTRTGRPVHTLQVPAGKPTLAVYEGRGRLYVATSSAPAVRIYDLKNWMLLKTIPPPTFSPFTYSPVWAVDESHGLLAIVSGAQGNQLSQLDAASGTARRMIQLPATPNSTNLVLDQQTSRAFIIGGGEYNMSTGVGKDGIVRTIDLATGALLHTAPVGAIAYQAVIDPGTHHLFVLSEDRTDGNGHVSLAASLVSMFDTRTGALLRSTKIPFTDVLDVASIVADGRAGFAYVNATGMPGPQETMTGHNLNNIVMLDLRTGILVRTIVLPQLVKATPSPTSEDLAAVAASSARDVWAVGGGGNDPRGRIVIKHWDGAHWRAVPTPDVEGRLNGIAAISPRDVWAVGTCVSCTASPLIMHWDGRSWQIVPSPVVNGTLHGVAAISARDVWAVGETPSTSQPNTNQALVLHWDGAAWQVVPSHGMSLWGVAAISAHDVWAVGYAFAASGDKPRGVTLTEHWDGSRWQVVPSPSAPAPENNLFTVTAISNRDVWAAGWSQSETATRALILHWDGVRWRTISVPTPGKESFVMGLAATSTRDVWGAGGTVMQHWDGTRWSVVPIASAATAADSTLLGVAAISARDVWAVGRVSSNEQEMRTLIEHWDGAHWRVVPS